MNIEVTERAYQTISQTAVRLLLSLQTVITATKSNSDLSYKQKAKVWLTLHEQYDDYNFWIYFNMKVANAEV